MDRLILDFKRNGLALPVEKRDQVAALKKRLSELEVQFQKNINEDKTALNFSKEDLLGMPVDFLESLSRSEDGKYIVTLKVRPLPP